MALSRRVRLALGGGLFLLLAVVAFQNSRPVALRFLAWEAEVDGLLLFLLLFLGGAVVGALGFWGWRRGRS